MLSKRNKAVLFFGAVILTGAGSWWLLDKLIRGDSTGQTVVAPGFPAPVTLEADKSVHQLAITRYRQVGPEIHLLPYTSSAGLAPFSVTLGQGGTEGKPRIIPKKPGAWLRFRADSLESGPFRLTLKSLKDSLCRVTAELQFDKSRIGEIADTSLWFRHGSFDDWLDVRVVLKEGKYYLKDFADYNDGRNRTCWIEGMPAETLQSGVEVRPGYLYTVVARWIDGSYDQWWNRSRNRTSRLQAVWIVPDTSRQAENGSALSPVRIPGWFSPSRAFNPGFDRAFPEFSQAKNKLVMMYRLNGDVASGEYLKRGITHLPRWEHDVPAAQQHWTEAPGFFEDRGQDWFASLSRQEVREYADRVGDIGVYAYDFEFWNRQYTPAVKQRLLWFSQRLKEKAPAMYLFDYWGGSAYTNTTFQDKNGYFSPLTFAREYRAPRSNHFNFEKAPDGDFFGRYYNVTAVDVYPRPSLLVGTGNFNLNNYLVLSAVHTSRINRLFSFQESNKTIWFAWNRFMPLYSDPPFPWHVETTSPEGSLVFNGLETIPASQALALSLFSLIEGDGFYLWNDSRPWGRGSDNYSIRDIPFQAPAEWWPSDGISPVEKFTVAPSSDESPRYWDYPSDFFALGNWMAHHAADILDGGERLDLPFFYNGKWHTPLQEQAVLAAHYHYPFVTAVRKGNRIAVLGLHSFQAPDQALKLTIRLPDNTETEIELYGNWPSLYTGTLAP